MKVVIIDTGCANLTSVKWAIMRLGVVPVISHDAEIIQRADKLLLPGVGTAQAAMTQLHQRHLVSLIARCRQPLLGICLGMQLMACVSDENPLTDTLNLLDYPVRKLATPGLPLPHMGWNQIAVLVDHPLLRGLNNRYFYFVHSYAIALTPYTLAECRYGQPFSAVIQKNNFFGVQFHPERSGPAGAMLLKNFLEMD